MTRDDDSAPGPAPDADTRDGPPRAWLIAGVMVAVVAVVAVLGIAVFQQNQIEPQPVPISAVPAPQAESPECEAVLSEAPDELGEYSRAETADPAPAGAAAWRADSGSEPVVLRCGLNRPIDFVVGSPLQVVNAVQWLRVAEAGTAESREGAQGRSTWYVVDRPVYIALTLPPGSGPTPIQQISDVVAAAMPATPIDPAPPR